MRRRRGKRGGAPTSRSQQLSERPAPKQQTLTAGTGRRELLELAALGVGAAVCCYALVAWLVASGHEARAQWARAAHQRSAQRAAADAAHVQATEQRAAEAAARSRQVAVAKAALAKPRTGLRQSQVAAGGVPEPTRVTMPTIKTSVPLIRLGTNPDGTMEVPRNYSVGGWYEGAYKPGAPGPSVLAGHVDSQTGPAAFFRLHELRPRDAIRVSRTDGSYVSFRVDRVEQHRKDAFPTGRVYGPTRLPALRLITCTGAFDEGENSYTDNLVVYASLQGPPAPRPLSPGAAPRRDEGRQ